MPNYRGIGPTAISIFTLNSNPACTIFPHTNTVPPLPIHPISSPNEPATLPHIFQEKTHETSSQQQNTMSFKPPYPALLKKTNSPPRSPNPLYPPARPQKTNSYSHSKPSSHVHITFTLSLPLISIPHPTTRKKPPQILSSTKQQY